MTIIFSQNGSSECCRLILQDITGATLVNCKDYSGKCALHYAAAAGNADIIKLIAEIHGSDLESEDPDDRFVRQSHYYRYGISVSQMTTDMFHLSLTLPGPFLIHDLSLSL